MSDKVDELIARFSNDYRIGRSPAVRSLERRVLGCDYGGTSWTTRDEAQRVAALLDLRPGLRLLDVGAGSGWPGLYLSTLSGCDVVLTDLPWEGLKVAAERALADGLADRCGFVVADGAALPFSDGSFDAISHSDVLCCTPAKVELLRACRRVARLGAGMVFSVIAIAPSLSPADRQRACESGPPFVDADADYAVLLSETGWQLQQRIDLSAAFAQTLRARLDGLQAPTPGLLASMGEAMLSERVGRVGATLAAVGLGLLRRELFVVSAG